VERIDLIICESKVNLTKIHHSFAANSVSRNRPTAVKLQTVSNSGSDILTRDPTVLKPFAL